jgi:flagellar biosynthetic protein FlhB
VADDDQEKPHDASQTKLDKAAEKGQIIRSSEISSAAIVLAGGLSLLAFGPFIGDQFRHVALAAWGGDLSTLEAGGALDLMGFGAISGLTAVAPVLGVVIVAILFVGFGQTRFKLATKALEPKPDRLNPFPALTQKFFSLQPIIELTKGLLKLGALGGVVWWTMKDRIEVLFTMAELAPAAQLAVLGSLGKGMLIAAAPLLIVLGIIDYAYNAYKHGEDNKMSTQEVKDERKDADGDPMVKAQRRAKARQYAMGQMSIAAVKEADLVITNPTHYAVAIRYRPAEYPAPIIIAKGLDAIALKIKAEARRHDIAQVENRPLARALHAQGTVGQAIPEGLFQPVAGVLALVYTRRQRR